MARLKKIVTSVSAFFQALKYGSVGNEPDGISEPEVKSEQRRSKGLQSNHKNSKGRTRETHRTHQGLNRQLSASDGSLSNLRMPEHQRGGNKSMVSVNNNSVSDVVAHVITEASTSSPLARQPIRVINGCRPELQSQVLLNTKTSQPFDDLVRDLAASVRIPKQPLGNVLETLSGRHIRSYSQLRSELRAGQRAFYVYSYDKAENQTAVYNRPLPTNFINHYGPPNGNRVTMGNGPYRSYLGHKPLAKSMLGKVDSNSSSDLSIVSKRQKQRRKKSQTRRRSHSPTPTSRSLVGVSNTNAYSPYS